MLHGFIDVPTIAFWEFDNIWTGSAYQTFNYRIAKVTADERTELYTVIWYGMKCFEILSKEEYACEHREECSAEGLEKTIEFINGKVEEFKAERGI